MTTESVFSAVLALSLSACADAVTSPAPALRADRGSNSYENSSSGPGSGNDPE